MIAIRVTQQILDQNDVNYALDSIQLRNEYPNKFWVTEKVDGGYKYRTDLHEPDGWKPFELPTYDERTQKLGQLIEEPTRFTREIVDKNQAEIDAYDQEQLDNDQHALIITTRRQDGYEYYYQIMALIERAWRNGQISNAIANAANIYFDEALEPLLRGNWQKSKTLLAVPPVTSNTPFQNTYDTVKTYVDNYSTQTYSKP